MGSVYAPTDKKSIESGNIIVQFAWVVMAINIVLKFQYESVENVYPRLSRLLIMPFIANSRAITIDLIMIGSHPLSTLMKQYGQRQCT